MEMTNLERLLEAGVAKSGHSFSEPDIEAINALSCEEVDALISVYTTLGEEFLERNCPHGIVF